METTAIILITTPIFLPIAVSLGMDPVVYAVVMTINLMIGAITPPLAVTLYTASSILKIRPEDTFPFLPVLIVSLLVSLVVHQLVPELSLYLPRRLLGYGA